MVEALARTLDPESEVHTLLDSYFDAVRASDLERIAAHYAPDVVAYDAIAKLEFRGVDAYRSHWKACLAMCQNMVFEPHQPVIAAAGDVAFAHCLMRCGGTDADGNEQTGWMRASFALRSRGGLWLIVHEHYSAPFDPESWKALLDLKPDDLAAGEAAGTDSHGKFVWYELMTTDPKAAEEFYRKVLGWRASDPGIPGRAYTIFSAGEAGVGGMMALPEEAREAGARPGWIGYVAVDDVDNRAAQFAERGGKVHRAPDDIPGVGRFAMVADPQGAVLALYKANPGNEQPQAPMGKPGHGAWRELHAADWQRAFGFYTELFGWTKAEAVDMGPMGTYQLYAAGDETLGGMWSDPDAAAAPYWLYYFAVDGIDAAQARVEESGGSVLYGPQEVPGGAWILNCRDPQGAMFALVGPRG
jgi:uncharacterized protein